MNVGHTEGSATGPGARSDAAGLAGSAGVRGAAPRSAGSAGARSDAAGLAGLAGARGDAPRSAGSAGPRSDATGLIDIAIPLPDMWTYHELGASERATAEAELAEMLADQVDDPEAVASASMDEFMQKLGAGSLPLLVASFREDLNEEDDEESAILAASLIVTRNDLSGSLDPWREAYGDDADEVEVLGAPALRIEERMNVNAGDLFADPVQVVTWRYVVPFGPKSVLLFAFSTPNHELDDLLLAHVDEIMRGVTVTINLADPHADTSGNTGDDPLADSAAEASAPTG